MGGGMYVFEWLRCAHEEGYKHGFPVLGLAAWKWSLSFVMISRASALEYESMRCSALLISEYHLKSGTPSS